MCDVTAGVVPGLIAYENSIPVGWCSVVPQVHFNRLDRSPILKKVDAYRFGLLYVSLSNGHRNTGLFLKLLRAAVEYVRQQGGLIIEGYLHETKDEKKTDPSVYTGLYSAFLKAGFIEVVRRSEKRPVLRYHIQS